MGAVTLPPMPDMPTVPGSNASSSENKAYDQAMLKYQDDMARYNRSLQFKQQQNEEQATRSNMEKSRHDAMMGIVNNLKA